MQQYDPKIIEPKWQKYWDEVKPYHVEQDETKEKFFGLIEFPYPSGAGLHVGHPRPFTAMDVITRKKRMEGLNVLFPIGFDAFGLPTENFAIKTGRPPAEVTAENIANFTRQLKMLGYGFDWDRAVDTTDPKYYKWTQWIFLQLFKHGLAYKKNMPINWCINCKIGLANEEVVDGRCERCGGPVEKRDKEQWMLAITKYADSLLEGLKDVDYIPQARTQQENWIGRSEGAEVIFTLRVPGQGEKHSVTVFTTRPDTLFGATFLAISAELAKKWMDMGWAASDEIISYIEKTITERVGTREEEPEKTGIDAGITAINPATGKDIPVWITNYVLGDVGTGAIMAVPAHDERDWDFAKKYGLPIRTVVTPLNSHCFIVHGSPDDESDTTYNKHWMPWTTRELTESGLETSVVNMPKPWSPEYDAYKKVIESLPINEQSILIGHSSGAAFLVRWLGETKRKIKTLVLVAPWKIADSKNEVKKAFYEYAINPDVKRQVEKIIFFTADNEEEAGKQSLAMFHDVLGGEIITISEYGHYTSDDMETEEFPQLVEKVFETSDCYTNEGIVVSSDFLNGSSTAEAKEKMITWLEEKGIGKKQVNFKLRDWVFSRQRYWGEPIPLVFCEHCEKDGKRESKGEEMNPGWIPLSETELPLMLPMVEKYEPTDTGESPLATMTDWVRVKCPRCGGDTRRETDTMPNWAGSSWYFLRYCDPNNDADFFAETDFRFKPEIDVTPKDLAYIDAFKKMYSDLNKKDVRIFAANRFLLNGLNGRLWLPLKTISVMFWKKDEPTIFDYLKTSGYVLEKEDKGGHVFTNGDIKVEIIPVIEEGGRIFSYTPQGNTADMSYNDFPLMEGAHLHGFWYRTVSPEYNLKHYKFVQEHETPDRIGLGDDEKIEFLEKYTKCLNPALRYWTPVDWYNGGMEHTVLHLLYSRFWNQFLFDIGVVPTKEPYKKRTSHGMILAKGGEKMSKSKGNVVNPDDMVEQFGADALRAYIMFMGPFDQAVEWDVNGLVGVRRFLDRVWSLQAKLGNASSEATDKILHQTVKKVTEDIDAMRFNTAIAKMMELVNAFHKEESLSKDQLGVLVRLLAPYAPHMTEDLWQDVLGNKGSVGRAVWPGYDEGKLVNDTCMLAVQVNGKVRGDIEVAADISDEDAKTQAMAHHNVQKWLEGKEPKKVIYVKGKLVSIVV